MEEMINLKSFVLSKEAIVPILNNGFQYNRKRYALKYGVDPGWYKVKITGNDVIILEPYMIENIDFESIRKMSIKGYTYNNLLIPFNFDSAERKFGMGMITEIHFNNSPTFSSIEAIMWEDKNLYYYRPNYMDVEFHKIHRNCLPNGTGDLGGVKGVTPEMRTVFLFHAIERIRIQKMEEELENKKKAEEFMKTLPGRLYFAFSSVGAKILGYSQEGSKIVVDWKLDKNQTFNSVIDANTFRVLEAGYCMSGDDKRHSIKSMVLTAEEWDKKRKIHKTRYKDAPVRNDPDDLDDSEDYTYHNVEDGNY